MFGNRHFRGRADLDRVPSQADAAGSARGEAGDLGCPRGHQARRLEGSQRHLAALPPSSGKQSTGVFSDPPPHPAQRHRPCWQGRAQAGPENDPRIAFWPGSISAFIATACAQGEADQRLIGGINRPPNAEADSTQWRAVADQIRRKVPKLAALMDRAMVAPRVRETMARAEDGVLTYMSFPKEHRAKLHSPNPIERLNGEIKRRTEVVGPRAFLRTDGRNALDPQR